MRMEVHYVLRFNALLTRACSSQLHAMLPVELAADEQPVQVTHLAEDRGDLRACYEVTLAPDGASAFGSVKATNRI